MCPGTAYDEAKVKALSGYKGKPKTPSGSRRAIEGLRSGNQEVWALADVLRQRGHLEQVLDDDGISGLSADAVEAFQRWHKECLAIIREAERLKVDGFYYLCDIHQSADLESSYEPRDTRALIESRGLGGQPFGCIKSAADSLMDWARENLTPASAPIHEPTDEEKALAELKTWVEGHLKGKQQRVLRLVIEHGGEYPLADIAIDTQIQWERPYTDPFNGIRQAVDAKMKAASLGWRLERNDSKARLLKVG